MTSLADPAAVNEPAAAAMARVYLRTGWSVFPVWWAQQGRCACPEGPGCASPAKHPITRKGLHDATRDEATAAAWWRRWPRANVGLPVGANGLAVLDVDPGHGGGASLRRLADDLAARRMALPPTLTAVTGSGGLHLFYAAPDGGIKCGSNVFGPGLGGLDTRGRGGYVVAPPSVHATGGEYTWLNFAAVDPAPWPEVLSTLMSGAEVGP